MSYSGQLRTRRIETLSGVLSSIVSQFGIGGVGGFIAGFAIKKIGKLIAFLIVVFVIFIMYLGMREVISINYNELWNVLSEFLSFGGQVAHWLVGVISLLPFAGSFVVGFLLGFKLG